MSTASGRAQAQKKVRRQKQFIAVGSVVLLAILGFEMTKMLPHGGGQTASTGSPATTSPGVAAAAPSSSGWNLPDTDRVVVQRSANQLISFGLFGSKDPFVQQLAVASSPAAPAAAAPAATAGRVPLKPSIPAGSGLTPVTATTPAPSAPANPTPVSPAPAPAPATTSQSTPVGPEAAPTTALISTNGACEKVAVKGTFPSGEDIFRLVSIARDGKSVEIDVVGGSFDSGQPTTTLKAGQTLTLVNTGDGTRYVIQLKSKCDVRTTRAPGTSASPATTPSVTTTVSPVPPAPTTTTTTPIVTDSLDTTTTPTG